MSFKEYGRRDYTERLLGATNIPLFAHTLVQTPCSCYFVGWISVRTGKTSQMRGGFVAQLMPIYLNLRQ